MHPPLARIAMAALPYAYGVRIDPEEVGMWRAGLAAIYGKGGWRRNLTLARLGILPFFVLATLGVWSWSRRLFGDTAGLLSAGVFTHLPVVLAHSGLATTDACATGLLVAAFVALIRWLEAPSLGRSMLLGSVTGAALTAKFSAIPFLLVGCSLVFFCSMQRFRIRLSARRVAISLATSFLCLCLTVWSVYRFSAGPLTVEASRPHEAVDSMFGSSGRLHQMAYALAEFKAFPAPEFFRGIEDLRSNLLKPRYAYLLGNISLGGWWYFFPVALFFKSPLAFVILSLFGLALSVTFAIQRKSLDAVAPSLIAVAILLICMPSRVNIGTRHVLLVYPLLSVASGYAAVWLWRHGRLLSLGRISLVGLLGWQLWSVNGVHPDYLPYFNETGGDDAGEILVDSDLDWGQDLERLAIAAKRLRIDRITIGYGGPALPEMHHLPPFEYFIPRRPVTGWVAISEYSFRMGQADFQWLTRYKPIRWEGKSIRLYNIPR